MRNQKVVSGKDSSEVGQLQVNGRGRAFWGGGFWWELLVSHASHLPSEPKRPGRRGREEGLGWGWIWEVARVGDSHSWCGPRPRPCRTPSARAAQLGVIPSRPRGGRCPVTARSGHVSSQRLINWQPEFPTRPWSWWRRRRPWLRPIPPPRCRRRQEPEGPLPAGTSTGCAPFWPEVGVSGEEPACSGGRARSRADPVFAAAVTFLDSGWFSAGSVVCTDLL